MNNSLPDRPFKAFKPLVVFAILALSALPGLSASPRPMIYLTGVVACLVFCFIFLRRPIWGLYALILVSFFGRWEIGTGTKVSLNLTLLLATGLLGLWILRMLVVDREVLLFPSRINAPALLFVLGTTLSLIAGNIHWVLHAAGPARLHAQLGAWGLYVLPMGILLLAGNQVRDLACLRRLTWLFLGVGGLYLAARMIPALAFVRLQWFVPTKHMGSMFWVWLVALSAGQCLFNHELHFRWRGCLALLGSAAIYAGFSHSQSWISGWLPPLTAVSVMLCLHSPGSRLALLAACSGWICLNFNYQFQAITAVFQDHSVVSRQAAFPIMIALIKASPILGLGPANYYHYTILYPILGWYVRFSSHNNYLDILAQTGLLGFAFFTWLIFELFRSAWRLRQRAKDGFTRGYSVALMGGLAGMLVSGFMGDWFLPFVYNISTGGFRASLFAWLFLGGLLALERMHANTLTSALHSKAELTAAEHRPLGTTICGES